MSIVVTQPFLIFYDRSGQPLDNGYIYIGLPGINPEVAPITVYWDSSLTTTAAQPIRTLNGYPSRNGSPSNIIASQSPYSILIKDKTGALVYSNLNYIPDIVDDWQTFASAATVDLSTATSNNILISGSVTITSFGIVASGTIFKLRFSGAPIITHNATSLILPGGQNLKMFANDTMEIVSLGLGNWICTSYAPANRQIGTLANPAAADPTFGVSATSTTAYYNPGTGLANAFALAFNANAHLSAGTGLISCGVLANAYCDGTWGPGGSLEAGAVALFTSSNTSRGGTSFGAGFHANCDTTNGAFIRGIEVDTICSAPSVASRINMELVSTNSDTSTVTGSYTIDGGSVQSDSAAIRFNTIGAGAGYAALLFSAKPAGGSQPVPVSGKLWRAGGFTCANGLDWRDMRFSDNMIVVESGNAKARITPKYDFDGSFSDFLLMGANYNTATATVDSASLGTALMVVKATNAGQGNIQFWTGAANTAPTVRGFVSLGLVMGSPSGGDMGAGTINATAVYDDGVILSCFVFDAALDGNVDHAKWHDKVPDIVEPAKPVRMVQKTVPRTVEETVIEIIDGRAVQKIVEKTVYDPVTEEIPVFDTDGNPVMTTLEERERGPDVQATAPDGTPMFDATGKPVMGPTFITKTRTFQLTTTVPVMIEAPAEDEVVVERRFNRPMEKFSSRLGTEFDPLTLDGYAHHWKTKRHLTAFPNETRFKHGDMSTGEWIQRLIEDAEIKAVLIEQLNAEIKLMKQKVATNENDG